jgi:hypothetical protein
MSSDVRFVNTGAVANDGTGDAIRTAFTTVNGNFSNIDARISTGNFGVVYSGTYIQANLTLTSLGPTLTDTLEVYSTANIAGNAQIANLSVNNAFVASTVTSTGNTYVQNSLNVTNDIQVTRNVVIGGNLTVLGNSVTVSSADLAVKDSLVNLHTVGLNPLTLDDGKDIGIQFHYYKTSDKHAALVWANDSQSLEFYADGTETVGNTFTGTYGNVKIGSLFTANTTAATSKTTGSIVTRGGIAAAGNIYATGFNGNLDGTRANVANLSVTGSVLGSLYFTGADTIYINGSAVATSAASFAGGSVPGYSLFNAVLEARGNIFANSQVASVSTTTGAIVVNGGVGISGALNVGGAISATGSINAPVGTVTPNSGAFTTITSTGTVITGGNIVAGSGTPSIGITTGALVVKGGAGISGNLYVGGSINNTPIGVYGSSIGNFSSIGDQGPGSAIFTRLQVNNTTVSSSLTSGAIIVAGGVGVSGNVYANGVYANNIGFANGSPFVSTAIAATTDITANIPSGPSVGVSLTTTGVTAGIYGNTTAYPVITVDSKGRISSAVSQIINLPLVGTSGTGAANGSLTFASSNGVTASVAAGTVTISTPQDLRTSATPTFAGMNVSAAIVPTGNATVNLGSVTNWFNNIYGVSSQAKYADLAENYLSDGTCGAGDVVIFGGDNEITIATEFADTRVAGVISTNPAYLMNADFYQGQPVALRGRVPCKVIGKVAKGDLLVSSTTPGCAVSVGKDKSYGPSVFGKSLNDKDDDGIGTIEAVIL